MVIQIPDDLFLQYEAAARAAHGGVGSPLDGQALVVKTLERFVAHATHPRSLVLSGLILQQVDRVFGAGSTKDPATFLTKVQEYAGISIGNVRLEFSPAQKAEIAHRAARTGRSPEDVAREIIGQMEQDFFHVGRAEV